MVFMPVTLVAPSERRFSNPDRFRPVPAQPRPTVGQVDPQVRPVLPTDAAALLALYAEMSRESAAVAARTASFVERFADYHVVAELDGVVVARAALVRTPGMAADTIAAGVGVTASARRRGIATVLWNALAGQIQVGTRWVLAFSDDRDDRAVLPFTRRHHLLPFQHSITSQLDLGAAAAAPPRRSASRSRCSIHGPPLRMRRWPPCTHDSDTSPDSAEIGARTWAEELVGAGEMGDRGLLVLLRRDGRPVAMSLAVEQDAATGTSSTPVSARMRAGTAWPQWPSSTCTARPPNVADGAPRPTTRPAMPGSGESMLLWATATSRAPAASAETSSPSPSLTLDQIASPTQWERAERIRRARRRCTPHARPPTAIEVEHLGIPAAATTCEH